MRTNSTLRARAFAGNIGVVLVAMGLLAAFISCDNPLGAKPQPGGTITIQPEGTRVLHNIELCKIETNADGTTKIGDKNLANVRMISSYSSHSYRVEPGTYWIYLEYMNTVTGSSGWWTNKNNRLTVADGEEWIVSYGYSGGSIWKR